MLFFSYVISGGSLHTVADFPMPTNANATDPIFYSCWVIALCYVVGSETLPPPPCHPHIPPHPLLAPSSSPCAKMCDVQ